MTRADIVERFRQEVDFTKKECTQMVKLVFEILKRTIENGEDVNISQYVSIWVILLTTFVSIIPSIALI